jgi:glycerol-3-phosphate acyltransferase PlsX
MKIGIDAMGGDHAPKEILLGVIESMKTNEDIFYLYGNSEIITKELVNHKNVSYERIQIIESSDDITNEDKPVVAIKRKKNSSMVKGLMALKNNEIDIFISAGNTGALLAGGLLLVGRIKGFDRPALTSVYPHDKGIGLLVDAGANSEVKSNNLFDFAFMGSEYAKKVMDIENPKVGLVNVGSEEGKGNAIYIDAYKLIKQSNLNFVGNLEGRDIPDGKADVIVADGFTGNIILKLSEGIAKTFSRVIKDSISAPIVGKLAGLIIKRRIMIFKKKMDYTEYGGAALLGIKGALVKAHGSSNAKAIKNAIKYGKKYVNSKVIETILEEAQKRRENEDEPVS